MAAPPHYAPHGGIPQPCPTPAPKERRCSPVPQEKGGPHSPTGGSREGAHSPRDGRGAERGPPAPLLQPHGEAKGGPRAPRGGGQSSGSHRPAAGGGGGRGGSPAAPVGVTARTKEGEGPAAALPAPPHPQLQHGGVDGGRPVPLEAGHHGGEEPVPERRLIRGVVAGALPRDGERPSAAGTTGEQRPVTAGAAPTPRCYLGRLQNRAPTAAVGRARHRPYLPGQEAAVTHRPRRPGPRVAHPASGGARRPQAGPGGQEAPGGSGERAQPQHGRSRGTRKRTGST